MNAQQLTTWMKDPASLGKEAGAQLDTLTQTFPYFQTAHLLLIKSLHNQNSFLYNNQLKVAAAYATNRRVLYELITKKAEVVESSESGVRSSELVASDEIVEEKNHRSEKPSTEEISHSIQSSELRTPDSELRTLSEEVIHPEFPKKRFVSNPDDWEAGMMRQLQLLHHWKTTPEKVFFTPKPEEPKDVPPPVKQEEVPQAKNETPAEVTEETPTAADEINTLLYVLVEPGGAEDISETEEEIIQQEEEPGWEVKLIEEDKQPEPEIAVPQDPVQQEIIREAISSAIELEVDDTLPKPEELVPPRIPVVEEPEPEPLRPVTSQKPVVLSEIPVKKPETQPEPEPETTGELSFAAWLKQVGNAPVKTVIETPQEPQEETTPPVSKNLIDRFIKEEPRISKPGKNNFYSPVNMAKKSVQESDEFITETLARIYAKQGNIPKAIRAYQKLSLKFPEKSSYFAALIEELKRTPR